MTRTLAKSFFALNLFCSGIAVAQSPVSVYPGTTIPTGDATPKTIIAPASATTTPVMRPTLPALPLVIPQAVAPASFDVLSPLSSILSTPLNTRPTVNSNCETCKPSSGVPCGTPLFSTARAKSLNPVDRPCLDRVILWLTFQPAPSCAPPIEPVPYHAPLRAYFPCEPMKNPGYPAACATGNCAKEDTSYSGQLMSRLGLGSSGKECTDPSCRAPLPKGFGMFAKPSTMPATTGELGFTCAPMAVPLPAACVGGGEVPTCLKPMNAKCGSSITDRLLGIFDPSCKSCSASSGQVAYQPVGFAAARAKALEPVPVPTSTVPVIMGYYNPNSKGYRFANPNGTNSPAAPTPYQTLQQAGATQPAGK